MIDVHNHVLFGIDDGSKNLEESINILKNMYSIGYTDVIATPHYISNNLYDTNNKKKKEILEILKNKLREDNIPMNLYLGNEVFIQDNIDKKIINGKIYSLNNSQYILIELPLNERINDDLDIIYELITTGAKVVLAHPERNRVFQQDIKELDNFLELGVLLQGNIDSLSGKYGKKAKTIFKIILKKRQYFVLGSDIHHDKTKYFKRFKKLKNKIIKLTDKTYFDELTSINPQKIINDENI